MRSFFTIILSLLYLSAMAQVATPFASGDAYKVAVEKDGVFRISYDQFRNMGFNTSQIDPRNIKIYGNPGGMLPQANSTARPQGLNEIAIYIEGEADGRFDGSDFILFYAQGPDRATWVEGKQIFEYENNLYADRNFYFIRVDDNPGKRIAPAQVNGSPTGTIDSFNDFVFHETDSYNILQSGRMWVGELMDGAISEVTLNFQSPGILPTAPVKIVTSVVGQSPTASSMTISLNGSTVGNYALGTIPNTRYGIKGVIRRDTFNVDAGASGAVTASSQALKFKFTKGTGISQARLDYALMSFERRLALYGNQTQFISSRSLANPVSHFVVANGSAQVKVWDITLPDDVKSVSVATASEGVSFDTETSTLKKFIVFNNVFESPAFVGRVASQNLHVISTPDLLIVTHPSFKTEAERLANHRTSFSQLDVRVVTADEIYNEFSSGRQDVSAIRDFIRMLWLNNPSKLKAALFFGKGSYDYKDRVPNNKNFVATYESRNSLHPLQTYSSDDYFGFLEDNEGVWSEEPAINHTLDIGVGRLPITTPAEAVAVVDKIIRYDTDRQHFGPWRKQIVFVADDGSGDDGFTVLHQSQADQLAQFVDATTPAIDLKKLYMGSYVKTVRPSSETIPALRDDILRAFDRGTLIINYTGHGNEEQWGDENVFNDDDITLLQNEQYPFLVTATCEFGRHDDPQVISSAEKTITHANGGAIGLVTTARPVNATTNFSLNRAFYEALLTKNGNSYLPLGEIFRRTKNNSMSGVSNRNFSLLGDPALHLALPPQDVVITSLQTTSGSDTLKALSTVIAKGEVRNSSGEKVSDFRGTVELTLLDKQTTFTTFGRNNPQLNYKLWYNALFRGQARVRNGTFEISFMMPKNLAYQIDYGKISAYALHDSLFVEAAGSFANFKVGGTERNVTNETTPPEIHLFMGDSTFVNGGIVSPDTWLVAKIDDNSGVNISGFGIGNSIIGTLDDDAGSFILNDYFVANVGDPSSGWVRFPLKGLKPGKHSITVTAWDVFNNSAEGTVDFIVTDGQQIVVETFGSYPNPFQESTTLFFTHNRSGDDLQAQLFIYNSRGEIIRSFEMFLPESEYHVDVMEFDPASNEGKKLSAGLYFARVLVRSLSNGSKNEQVTKLILLN